MSTSIITETGRALKPGQFHGTCARKHDLIEFTDPVAWTEHFKQAHQKNRMSVPRLQKPRPWKAPTGKAPDLRPWINDGDLEIEGVELDTLPDETPADRITRGHVLPKSREGKELPLAPARRCGQWAAHKHNKALQITHAPSGKVLWVAGYYGRPVADLEPMLLQLGPIRLDADGTMSDEVQAQLKALILAWSGPR